MSSTGPREASRKPGQLERYFVGITTVNKGTIVCTQADGWAYPGRAVAANGDTFVGVAYNTAVNSAGSAGGAQILVEKEGSFLFVFGPGSGTQALVGTQAYCSDDQTVTNVPGPTVIPVGEIVELIDANTVRVRINAAVRGGYPAIYIPIVVTLPSYSVANNIIEVPVPAIVQKRACKVVAIGSYLGGFTSGTQVVTVSDTAGVIGTVTHTAAGYVNSGALTNAVLADPDTLAFNITTAATGAAAQTITVWIQAE